MNRLRKIEILLGATLAAVTFLILYMAFDVQSWLNSTIYDVASRIANKPSVSLTVLPPTSTQEQIIVYNPIATSTTIPTATNVAIPTITNTATPKPTDTPTPKPPAIVASPPTLTPTPMPTRTPTLNAPKMTPIAQPTTTTGRLTLPLYGPAIFGPVNVAPNSWRTIYLGNLTSGLSMKFIIHLSPNSPDLSIGIGGYNPTYDVAENKYVWNQVRDGSQISWQVPNDGPYGINLSNYNVNSGTTTKSVGLEFIDPR